MILSEKHFLDLFKDKFCKINVLNDDFCFLFIHLLSSSILVEDLDNSDENEELKFSVLKRLPEVKSACSYLTAPRKLVSK